MSQIVRRSATAFVLLAAASAAAFAQAPASVVPPPAPLTRALCSPNGTSFSSVTHVVNAAITNRFITPPANNSSINAQGFVMALANGNCFETWVTAEIA